jgi:hypothetical protein
VSVRLGWGVAATAAVTAFLLPVILAAAWFALVFGGRYDTSGQGGPFRGCGVESSMCSEPQVLLVLGSVAVIFFCCICAGFAGMGLSGAGSARSVIADGTRSLSADSLSSDSVSADSVAAGAPSADSDHQLRAGWTLSGFSLVFAVLAVSAVYAYLVGY